MPTAASSVMVTVQVLNDLAARVEMRVLFDSAVPPAVRSCEAPWFARRWRSWSPPPLPLATGLHASVPVRRRKPANDAG
jgi:hypothetical protein